MKWVMDLKRKFYSSKKMKQQIAFYCDFMVKKNEIEDLEQYYRFFGDYIFNSKDFTKRFFEFANGLSLEDKETLLFNIIRTAIIYKGDGRTEEKHLWTKQEKEIYDASAKYISQVKNYDNYYELDGYKLPVNLFLKEIFYDRISLDMVNTDSFAHKDIIDAGASLGDSAIILSEYTSKNVYSFEPGSRNYDLLLRTIRLNEKTNIIPVNYGLGEKAETLKLCKAPKNIGGEMIIRNNDPNSDKFDSETIKVVTLDDYVNKNNLDVGLIKADVEAFEQKLLEGAKETIKKFKPVLLICTYHSPDDFFGVKALIESWDLGYKFKYIPAVSTGHFTAETKIAAEVEN